MTCPQCGSDRTECIGWYSVQIAVDDSVDIAQYICAECGKEWDE